MKINKKQKPLVVKSYDEYEVQCSETTFDRLEDIIKKQNQKLLRDIAIHYKWSYSDLCKNILEK